MRSVTCRRRVGAGLTLLSLVLAGCAGRVSPLSTADRSAAEPTYDVIVVGAGLAGLTTGQSLVRAEYSVLVLEASGRIGGRAITDATTFPVPVDLGAAWIHGANTNPLTSLVDWLGFTRVPTSLDGEVFIGSHRLTAEEAEEFGHDYERTEAAMAESPDVAASEFLPERPDFRALIAANIGPLESGAEIDRTSSADAAAFEADPDDFVREGIGTLVARIGRDLPVQLNSPVTAISYGGELDRGVLVATRSGQRYRGRRVVITVSTGVLSAGGITFRPELPAWKLQAIRELPMGLLNKVVFEFDGDVLAGEGANEWVLYQQPDPPADVAPEVMAFVIKPLGANLAIGFYGAEQARRFESLGDAAAIEYAMAALVQMYGTDVAAQIKDETTRVTRWGQNPWTLGSYSAALPGASATHETMAEPVDDLVFFAGEASGPPEYNGSLAAAYVSGLQASRAVQSSLAKARATPAH